MRVAILGAAGQMARATIRDLLEFHPEVEITAADREPVEASDARVRPVSADVRDLPATTRLLEGHDAVLNCVTYYYNLEVMRAALAARVPYADLGGLYHVSLRQYELDAEFRAAGVTAVLGAGSTPGITNALAGAMARGLERVDEIHVRVGCRDEGASGPLAIPYALDTLLDELTLEPMLFERGHARAVPPMSGVEEVEFPEPVGRMAAIYTLHSEVAMFPRSFPGLTAASFRVAFPPELLDRLRFLVELGFADRRPQVGEVSPRAMLSALAARLPVPAGPPRDADALRVDLVGVAAGRTVRRRGEAVIRPHSRWGLAAGALDTGIPLAVVGAQLARRELVAPGVRGPEQCLDFERFFAELERREIVCRRSELA